MSMTRVYFGVFDFGNDPGVVSKMMGIEPTKAWVKGDHEVDAPSSLRRTHSRWALESGLDEAESIEAHFGALWEKLQHLRAGIGQVKLHFHAQIVVAQYLYEVNPQFCIEVEVLKALADIGVPISFDQYCLVEDEPS